MIKQRSKQTFEVTAVELATTALLMAVAKEG
jgi:hypothetical protein